MNKSRKLSLINMFVNLAIIALEIVGIYLVFAQPFNPEIASGPEMLKYYTILTAIITFVAAGLMIWANIVSFIKKKDCTPRLFYSMRYLSAVMSLLTFVTVLAVLRPYYLEHLHVDVLLDIAGGSLFIHLLCPVISMIQFAGFEIEPKGRFKKTLEPFIATVIYAIGLIISVLTIRATQGAEAAAIFSPYYFCWITPDIAEAAKNIPNGFATNYLANIGTAIGVIALSYVASVILWLLNRMFHTIFIGEVYEIEVPNQAKGGELTLIGEDTTFANYMKRKVAFGDNKPAVSGQTYHISYHDRKLKTWKVKTENAGRALKVFPTQKEAIDFAKACVKKSGGSIRVHSMIGRIRKH